MAGPEKTFPWHFETDRAALLVIDMQNDFVAEGGVMHVSKAAAIIPKLKELIACCRECGVPVIYTVQAFHPRYNLCPLEVKKFPHLETEGMREGTPGIEIFPAIKPQEGDIIIKKRRFSAFYNTELELVLRNLKGINQIDTTIISGTVTNICCESTARDAFFRDFKVVFGSDVNAAVDEGAHQATLNNIETAFGMVMDADTIMAALRAGSSAKL